MCFWRDHETGSGSTHSKHKGEKGIPPKIFLHPVDLNYYKCDFLAKLQEIAAAYNFAQHNGYYHKVSGLPDMYGERLDIIYASGEQICAYDNQSRFLPYEAAEELILLFSASIKSENQSS